MHFELFYSFIFTTFVTILTDILGYGNGNANRITQHHNAECWFGNNGWKLELAAGQFTIHTHILCDRGRSTTTSARQNT